MLFRPFLRLGKKKKTKNTMFDNMRGGAKWDASFHGGMRVRMGRTKRLWGINWGGEGGGSKGLSQGG